ncbi:hypothetical protein SKAU_G00200830 [Synaphobranchus kaupii]|uniref:Uncharacterized protein n=1 Tax=Synaphobranchus kaupii TaxID=118154 RepID=A0A9Q1FFF7_SYNKA|nr:hypothetical protein SKAU_G00200830 [Synaphobranchus kaupii]
MNPRASCRKDTGILLWTRDCKPDSTTERRMLLTSLDKTDIDMQNRQNMGFPERKRSVDKEWSYKQEVTSSDSPSREPLNSSNLRRRPLAKGLAHDLAQMRKDKLVPRLPGKYVDAPRLLRNINRRSVQNPQVSQEQSKSEKMYLMQRVKDLQATILKLDEERCDFNNSQSMKEEHILGLEKQIHVYSCKMGVAGEEFKKSQAECSSLREHKTKSENVLSDSQCKLNAKVRELQNALDRNEQLEHQNDTLFEQLNGVREGFYNLQSMMFQLNQDKEDLREQLDKKDKVMGCLNVKVEKLETSAKSLREEVSRGNRELDAMQRTVTDTKEQLNAAVTEKDATFQANSDLQDDLDKVHLDNVALQRKMEGPSQEAELLQRKLQDFMAESSCSQMLLSSQKEVIENLKYGVKELETAVKSLQQEVNRGNSELDAVQRKLTEQEKQLNAVLREKEALIKANADLKGDRYRIQVDNQAMESRVEGSSQEVELLQKKLRDCIAESSQMEMMLWSKEDVIEDLELTIDELESSAKSLQQEVSRELDAVQRKLTDKARKLSAVVREKEALLKTNTDLHGDFDRIQFNDQREVIENLQLQMQELETSLKTLQEALCERDRELDTMRTKHAGAEKELDSLEKEKEAIFQANAALRDYLNTAKLDNQTLQRKVEGSSQEGLQRKLQECVTESSYLKILLSSKEDVIEHLQVAVKELRTKGLQQEASRDNGELDALQRKLKDNRENLDIVLQEKELMLKENADLKSVLAEVQLINQALQCKVEGSSQEVELLQKKLQECMTESVSTGTFLSSKDDVIGRLQLTVEELEESAKSLQQALNRVHSELGDVQKKLRDAEQRLGTVVGEKEVMLKERADLQGHLDKMQDDNRALQRKADGSSQEAELLRKTLQDYMTESTHTKILLSAKEDSNESMLLRIQELETSAKSLQQEACERDRELDAAQKRLTDAAKDLDFAAMEKEAALQANARIRPDFDKLQLDNQALQRKVDGSSQEAELLQKKLQDYMTESTHTKILLSAKEDSNESMLLRIQELETSAKSLQQEACERDRELDAAQKRLTDAAKDLDFAAMEKEAALQANARIRPDFDKLQLDNQALQRKVDGSSQEAELLQKKLQDYMTESTHTKILLSAKEDSNESMLLRIQELETSAKSLQQEACERDRELDAAQKRLTDAAKDLDFAAMEKEAALQANARIRPDFDKLRLDNQALQCKVDGSSQEAELLQKKLQECMTGRSQDNILLSSKEEAIARMRLTVTQLETSAKSLQQEVSRANTVLDAVHRKLTGTEENLDSVIREKGSLLKANTDLQDTLGKIQLDNQALQRKVDGSSQEADLLQRKLQDSVSKLSCTNEQLSFKEEVIETLELTVKELETSVKNLQQSTNRAQKEFEFARKRVSNTEEILSALMKEKETIQKENLGLRNDLYSVHSGNQALYRRMEGSSQEVELLQMELQDFSTDVNILQSWVTSSEAAIARLLKTFEGLEPSVENLQQAQHTVDMNSDATGSESKSAESESKSADTEPYAAVPEEEGRVTPAQD